MSLMDRWYHTLVPVVSAPDGLSQTVSCRRAAQAPDPSPRVRSGWLPASRDRAPAAASRFKVATAPFPFPLRAAVPLGRSAGAASALVNHPDPLTRRTACSATPAQDD
jgi:hypothetical protein